jgi:hypothetical protein
MALVLEASKLLIMVKDIGGFCPIVVVKCFFNLLVVPLFYSFGGCFKSTYPLNQFKVSTFEGCEAIPFDIKALLDLHLD